MFEEMMRQVRSDVVHHIFHLNLERFDSHAIEQKREHELDQINMASGTVTHEDANGGQKTPKSDKVGRNDPCPCGSGKKYKKCHGA